MRTEQIVAKALQIVNNDRYILSNIIFKRVKQLTNGAQPLVSINKGDKFADVALKEIAEGKLVLERIDDNEQA